MGQRRLLIIGFVIVCVAAPVFGQGTVPRSGPPSWARDAIWYSVAIDRFRNGDPRNDPKASDLRGASPGDPGVGWQLAPWTSSWYAPLPAERAANPAGVLQGDAHEAVRTLLQKLLGYRRARHVARSRS